MFTQEKLTIAITKFNEKIQENREYLSELDTPIGDGDHGNNMARGMEAAMAAGITGDCSQQFKQLAMTLIGKVGGASGPLYGTAMMEMSKASKDSSDPVVILTAGIAGIEKRGRATLGEKTMLDLWIPTVEALKNQQLTAEKLNELVEATKDLLATKGRASYVGERSIGHIDPGAMSSKYFFEALLEAEVFTDD
ncbi:dihydroxyacetone kinase-like protein [Enterococcus sp. PF1-24]|uniref:dihydroxyacetone kinase subunit DhaL n=1 Tax=unclassified Enterococcus TaxID=2608891 RepID=UPI002476CCCD|nr:MULTISPECIES: dihydroxyacetone kinase subunit DhaL [unclassified Enterococcus]MDH6365344.1 dihydroxyacetone kinase-like protein [Enterococcus sp. PFB1-1]MDH6402445.1 dihydroxyacetone kinase-like protein [Enterococcus sp. PF1-24]